MVLSFSGTGNSHYAARRVADALGDSLLSINDRVKADDTTPIQVNGRLVVVTPTYAWRIPRVVRDWLAKTDLIGAARVWFVMTCGSEIGGADRYNRALCDEKGLVCMGTAEIVMPENYIAMFNVPGPEEAQAIVRRAGPVIDRAITAIAEGRPFPPSGSRLSHRLMSGPVNPVFYRLCIKVKPFTVSGACVGCGQCVRNCPLNNITLHNGRPLWGGRCTHCMACVCRCPVEAIEYGKKSLGKPRYRLDTPVPPGE